MPGWLIAALSLLGLGVGAASAPGGVPLLPAVVDPFESGGLELPSFLGGPRAARHRHRRKRALTASDRADIAFIVGLLGQKAGSNFAVTLAAR